MQLENSIYIDADLQTVWQTTVDIEKWPEWTPTVTAVRRLDDGPLAVGSKAVLTQPGLPDATWKVTALQRGKVFTWETRVRSIHIVATHVLMPENGGTRNLLHVELAGLAARLLWPMIRPSIAQNLTQENAGLKRRCELRDSAEG